jgi:predicted dehydrogenase
MFSVSFIGFGNRGSLYAKYFAKSPHVKIVSACDIKREQLWQLHDLYGVDEENLFTDEESFFEKKRSDVLVIGTLDDLHCRQTVKALSLGYDVLLEKPIAPNLEDVRAVVEASEKYGRQVVICHNLRYTPFYQKMKMLIQEGKIGDILSIEHSENISYHHFMQSFVRGNWRRSDETSSIILQKCCHDLDILYWLLEKKCTTLSSFGSLRFYTRESAPSYATEKCASCSKKDCPYNAVEFFKQWQMLPNGAEKTDENIIAYFDSEKQPKGTCVFYADNDVCDRQIVNMQFDGGTTVNLLMHAFCAPQTNRVTKIYGTKGCLSGVLSSGKITLSVFGKEDIVIDVNTEITEKGAHLGGDSKLVEDYIAYKNGGEKPLGLSLLSDSIYSHLLAFAADRSRLANGQKVEV